jgi:hypothetical protein
MNIQFATRETPVITLPDRMVVLENLSVLRQEWEAAADGDSLINVSASVGLMLFDFTTKLGLTSEEQSVVLGGRLYNEATLKSQGEPVG